MADTGITVAPLDLLAHAPEARRLQVAALRTVAEATGVGPDPADDDDPPYARHAARPGYRCVGAWAGDRLVGYAYGMTSQPGSWWDGWVRPGMAAAGHGDLLDDAFELCAVFVDPQHHGAGAGRALVTALLADVDQPRTVLTTQAGTNPALGFYRHLGFTELPVEVDHDGVPFVVLTADLPLDGSRA